jgi:hypothetical protein
MESRERERQKYIKETGRQNIENWREKLLHTFLVRLLHQSPRLFVQNCETNSSDKDVTLQ